MNKADIKRVQRAIQLLILKAGSAKDLARLLHLHPQNIYEWRIVKSSTDKYFKRIPLKHLPALIKISHNELTPADLRPDIFKIMKS